MIDRYYMRAINIIEIKGNVKTDYPARGRGAMKMQVGGEGMHGNS
jgi:hypothetical protein